MIHEWTVNPSDPDTIDPLSRRESIHVAEMCSDHNIGQIGFDPNVSPGDPDYGNLYIVFGDGGCPVDLHKNSQDLSRPLGKMMRIHPFVDSGTGPQRPYCIPLDKPFANDGNPTALAKVYAYGLRNPRRFSWDGGGERNVCSSPM